MSRRARILALCAGLLAFARARGAVATDPAAMLARADAPHVAFSEGVISLRVTVEEHGKKPVENLLELFVKGKDQSLCVFRDGQQKGRKILTVGDRVWLIVPGTSHPVPVSKTQRLMGAASFGDIARLRFADEYEATLRPADEAVTGAHGSTPCHVLDLKAKQKGAAYPAGVLWTGREDGLARKLRLSLASGKEAKDVLFTAYGPESRLQSMEIRDLLARGGDSVTRLRFERYEPKALDPAIFDPAGARSLP